MYCPSLRSPSMLEVGSSEYKGALYCSTWFVANPHLSGCRVRGDYRNIDIVCGRWHQPLYASSPTVDAKTSSGHSGWSDDHCLELRKFISLRSRNFRLANLVWELGDGGNDKEISKIISFSLFIHESSKYVASALIVYR